MLASSILIHSMHGKLQLCMYVLVCDRDGEYVGGSLESIRVSVTQWLSSVNLFRYLGLRCSYNGIFFKGLEYKYLAGTILGFRRCLVM